MTSKVEQIVDRETLELRDAISGALDEIEYSNMLHSEQISCVFEAITSVRHRIAAEQRTPTPEGVRSSARELLASVLREHWLTGTGCDKEARTNTATCFCSLWRSDPAASPVEAVEAWIGHVLEHLPAATIALSPSPPTEQVERMREALEPFAARFDLVDASYRKMDIALPGDDFSVPVRLGKLRAARAALRALATETGDE